MATRAGTRRRGGVVAGGPGVAADGRRLVVASPVLLALPVVLVTLVLVTLVLGASPGATAAAAEGLDRATWRGSVLSPPVDGPVLRRFDAPTRYGPGHRGVDLAAPPGTAVRAPAAGTVAWAGRVVDDRWVTLDHGWVRTTVGPLTTIAVRRGTRVGRGAVIGTTATAHGLDALHLSARVGDRYVDPLLLAPPRVSLVPVHTDRPARPAPSRAPPMVLHSARWR